MRFVVLLTLAWAPIIVPAAPVGQGAPSTRVDRLLAPMTLAQKVGQMCTLSFDER